MQSHVCWAYFTLDGRHLTLVTAPTEEFQQDTPYTCVDHIHPDMLPSDKETVLFYNATDAHFVV